MNDKPLVFSIEAGAPSVAALASEQQSIDGQRLAIHAFTRRWCFGLIFCLSAAAMAIWLFDGGMATRVISIGAAAFMMAFAFKAHHGVRVKDKGGVFVPFMLSWFPMMFLCAWVMFWTMTFQVNPFVIVGSLCSALLSFAIVWESLMGPLHKSEMALEVLPQKQCPEVLNWCRERPELARYQRQAAEGQRILVRGDYFAMKNWIKAEDGHRTIEIEQASCAALKSPISA